MNCSECRDLYRIFERRSSNYAQACSSAFFRISSTIAARVYIDLQRALNDLQEHQADCPWAIAADHISGHLVN